ncbi:hypothetical protein AAFF_G00411480 [Aldrovandia affinis]|uniref:Uncharacterized protein n=1 Tax=Aldrovandia affinis TaxID=143900 RepID=A0AAD7SB99_9TELE|nr:hypothetical protein AAFF_G00411480 [Aldrovandia affinis]
MDGPNVNWKFLDLLQEEHAQLYGGKQLVTVGSCGLHTLHNAFKCGFVAWGLDRLLKAMHTLFNNVPARREDYMQVTKSSVFPLSFCAHRWVENLPVVERALAVWPSLLIYMEAVRTKKVPNPGTGSYDTIAAAIKDPLILAKLHFYMAIARTFTPFLKRYQTDEPVMPFLGRDLAEFLKSLLRCFIKRELLQDATTVQLTRLDITERKNWVRLQDVDIGLGAESILKAVATQDQRSSTVAKFLVTFSYNTTIHQSTGESPYLLMFGQEPQLPIDFLLGRVRNPRKVGWTNGFKNTRYDFKLLSMEPECG